MRVLLAGSPSERARLKATLNGGAIKIAGEFDTLTAARASAIEADAILLASRDNGSRGSDPGYHESLTPREVQVLELLAEGLPNKAIARRLDISDQTVKFHVASISGKLGAANRTDAVRRAARRGLITL
jgi:DNA-binding NarL/FixJ family response regulator